MGIASRFESVKAVFSRIPRKVWVYGGGGVAAAALILISVFVIIPEITHPLTILNADRPSYSHPDGLLVSLPEGVERVRVRVDVTPRETFLNESRGPWKMALEALPDNLTPLSPLYTIRTRGANGVVAEMAIPNGAEPLVLMDLYRWDAPSKAWVFLPGSLDEERGMMRFQPPTNNTTVMAVHSEPVVSTVAMVMSEGGAATGETFDLAFPEGKYIDNNGELIGTPVQSQATVVMPLVANKQQGLTNYEDVSVRLITVSSLMSFLAPYDGLVLDFDPGPGYIDFIKTLSERVHAHSKKLDLVVRMDSIDAYDLPVLSSYVDRIWIEVGDDPNLYLPNGAAENDLNELIRAVNRNQLGLMVSALTIDEANGIVRSISNEEALAHFGQIEVAGDFDPSQPIVPGGDLPVRLSGEVDSMGYDAPLSMNYLTYHDQTGQLHYVYFGSPQGFLNKASWARYFGLSGLAVVGISHPQAPEQSGQGLEAFLSQQDLPDPAPLAIEWEVRSASGASLVSVSGNLSLLQYLWPVAADPGSYVISARVAGPVEQSDRGQVAVQVGEARPTAESTPTPTGTPLPNATPDPNATPLPPPTPAPVSGAIAAGAFELGGQTQSFSHAAQMAQAGMTWVKFQHKWGPGDDPSGAVGGRIADAHSRGFKVLLSIPGPENPGSIDYARYVDFLAGVAALGPDGIEVWNEMNLPREWPLAEINGANYVTNMLAPAYQAIKAVNPAVLVISGAPAPTGVYGGSGCGPLACDELLFISQMRDAGASNFADCMGIHYNEGIIAPSLTAGDPRDAFYTRYFFGMINTYWSTFGKQLCFTELGYLTPEGYGALPSAFGWAQNTTVGNQADWLAQAAVLASQSGKVRLMIIFNVDFTVYGADPQGGYAIIRPGGGCPACDALAAVKP